MTETVSSDGSPSWLKQRTSIFNNATSQSSIANNSINHQPIVKKVVDKELASLKKIGAVSSVWSNKFVQEDNSGGTMTTSEYKKPPRNYYHITSPPLHPSQSSQSSQSPPPPLPSSSSSSDPSLSPRRSYKVNTSPRPNANYIPVAGTRQSFGSNTSSVQPTSPKSPKSPLFEKVRSLSGTKSMSDEIQQVIDQQHQQKKQSLGSLSKASMSSLDLNDMGCSSNRSSTGSVSSVTDNRVSSPSLHASAESDRTTIAVNPSIDEAAALWFQCETLKTQYAQNNARLNKATEDIEFYKRQLEQQGAISRQGIADAVEEKEKEVVRVRQLAQLIVKQDQLLDEYQDNLDLLTQLVNESTHLKETQAEMTSLRQELAMYKNQKENLEGTIAGLRAELEMSQSQMKLMMAVSTEIQNEYANYKTQINIEIKELLNRKQHEHDLELRALQEQLDATACVTTNYDKSVTADDYSNKQSQKLELLGKQVVSLTEALEARDKVILELESQLKSQKMSMDTQMMELTQSILEKDALLMEFMSSRNNSKEALPLQPQQPPQTKSVASTSIAPVAETNNYYHPASPQHYQQQQQQDNQLHMSQIRDYMYDSSDDDVDDEEQEQINYTSGEEQDESNTFQETNRYHQLMTHESSVPQSPADSLSSSISSTISFDSSEEEEKIAELKHFSYTSVQSQQTTKSASTESLTAGQDMIDEAHRRLSGVTSTSISPTAVVTTTATTAPGAAAITTTSPTTSANPRFSATKENSGSNWPMPPPTPPPSEPLPPVPVATGIATASVPITSAITQEKKQDLPIGGVIPPPRRVRSKTMARDEAPDMSLYTTSIHQTNELPRIIPLQRELMAATTTEAAAPIPPPRKDISSTSLQQQQQPHTKWMDDPESEEDDMWCETSTSMVAAL